MPEIPYNKGFPDKKLTPFGLEDHIALKSLIPYKKSLIKI